MRVDDDRIQLTVMQRTDVAGKANLQACAQRQKAHMLLRGQFHCTAVPLLAWFGNGILLLRLKLNWVLMKVHFQTSQTGGQPNPILRDRVSLL